jgi:hypothetical protein
MTARRSIAAKLAFVAVAIACLHVLPAFADDTIATVSAPTPVSAFGNRVAWSAFDSASATYRLMTESGGTISAVPVAPRTVPFDIDLGPNDRGHIVAAYSRCRRDPPRRDPAIGNAIAQLPDWSRGRGCDLYRFDFTTGREAKIRSPSSAHASEFLPSVWKRNVAFARVYERRPGRAGHRPYLYVQPPGGHSRRIPAGLRSRLNFCSGIPQRCRLKQEPGPTALDLWGRRLAFGWDSADQGEPTSSVYLDTLEPRKTTKLLLSRLSSGDIQGSEIVSPQVVDGAVAWTQTLYGETTSSVSRRYRITGGELSEAAITLAPGEGSTALVLASALDGRIKSTQGSLLRIFYLASGQVPPEPACSTQHVCFSGPGCSAQQLCALSSANGLVYVPVKRRASLWGAQTRSSSPCRAPPALPGSRCSALS